MAGLLLLFTAGCAYYNTLYHARRFYREAEQAREKAPEGDLPPATSELYLKAAKKCAKVITEHPQSRWVDDALLLMGDCFYRRGEYERALKKYEELRTLYPKSELNASADFMSGMALWSMGHHGEARSYFAEEKEKAREDERIFEAWLMLGRCDLETGGDAVGTLRELVAWPRIGKRKAEAQLWLGESLARAGQLEEATGVLREAAAGARDEALKRKIELRLGEMLQEKGDYAGAVKQFRELAARDLDPVRHNQLQLRLADAEVLAGDHEGALRTLEKVVEKSPKGDDGAEAQFRIGLIHQRQMRDYAGALAAYDKAREISPGAAGTRQAAEERNKILEAQRYTEELAALDSTGAGMTPADSTLSDSTGAGMATADSTRAVEKAKTHFLLAEVLLEDLSDPERALEHYLASAQGYPRGEYAPRALMGASWVLSNRLARKEEAEEILRRILRDYPESPQALRARALLGEEPPPGEEPSPREVPVPGEVPVPEKAGSP